MATQAVFQRFVFEIDATEDHVGRNAHFRRGDSRELVGLGCGLVDLENLQRLRPRRLAREERVVTGAEHDVLAHAAGDGLLQPIFRETRAEHDVSAQHSHAGYLHAPGGFAQPLDVIPAQQIDDRLVLENQRLRVEHLVRGAHPGDAQRSAAFLQLSHRGVPCRE